MSQLQLFETFAPIFNHVQQQLENMHFPILLFKTIARRREIKEKAFMRWSEYEKFASSFFVGIHIFCFLLEVFGFIFESSNTHSWKSQQR